MAEDKTVSLVLLGIVAITVVVGLVILVGNQGGKEAKMGVSDLRAENAALSAEVVSLRAELDLVHQEIDIITGTNPVLIENQNLVRIRQQLAAMP